MRMALRELRITSAVVGGADPREFSIQRTRFSWDGIFRTHRREASNWIDQDPHGISRWHSIQRGSQGFNKFVSSIWLWNATCEESSRGRTQFCGKLS